MERISPPFSVIAMLDVLHVRRVPCTGILKVQEDTSELVQLGMLQQPLSLTGRSDCGVLKCPGLSTLGNWRRQHPPIPVVVCGMQQSKSYPPQKETLSALCTNSGPSL
jgi:hypothetical protein